MSPSLVKTSMRQTSFGAMEEQQQNNGWDKRCMTDKCNRGATVDRQGDVKSDNQDHTLEVKFNMQYDGVLSLVKHTAREEMREECRGVDNEQQKGSHLSTKENMGLIEEDPCHRLQLREGHHIAIATCLSMGDKNMSLPVLTKRMSE